MKFSIRDDPYARVRECQPLMHDKSGLCHTILIFTWLSQKIYPNLLYLGGSSFKSPVTLACRKRRQKSDSCSAETTKTEACVRACVTR